MLTNPFYIGVVEWNGARYPGQHKALISETLFNRVQDVLRSRDKAGVRERRHDHYLKGLLLCADCGRRLSLTLAKGQYLYFYCLGQKGVARTGCAQPYILADDAERLVEKLYAKIQLPETWVERLTGELEDEIVARQADASERRVILAKKLSKLADERQKLLRAYYANAIALELLKADQDRITTAETRAKTELADLEGDLTGWREVLTMAIRQAGNCHEAYCKGRPSVRRRLNDVVFRAVYILDGKVHRPEFTEIFEPLFARPSSNKRLNVEVGGCCVNRFGLLNALRGRIPA